MQEFGLFEAKNKLSELVSRAEKGEEITITRHGHPAARLMPARRVYDPEKARAAIEEMRKLAREMNLGPFNWEEWKALRDEGRP